MVGRVMRALKATGGVPNVRFLWGKNEKHEALPNGDATARRVSTRQQFNEAGHQVIARLLMKGPMTTRDIAPVFVEAGRSKSSVHSQLNYLKDAGDVKKDADGERWMLTKKGRDRMRHKATAARKTKQ